MDREKIVIFGVGNKYKYEKEKHKLLFEKLNVVGYLDNNSLLWGTKIDEIPVISPMKVHNLKYDKIVLMAEYVDDMRRQLKKIGILPEHIFLWDQIVCEDKHGIFIEYKQKKFVFRNKKKILLLSVKLNYNGGTIAILNAAIILERLGYSVTVSATGGELKLIQEMQKNNIDVIVAPAINYPEKEELDWIRQFDIIIVNVFQMIRCACLISHIKPVLWWIHENNNKYDRIYSLVRDNQAEFDNLEVMKKIRIVAVSLRAKNNFNEYYTSRIREVLPFGILDTYAEKKRKRNNKCIFAIIGGVYPTKAQLIFLDAIDRLEEDEKEKSEFWIIGECGEHPYADEVRKKVGEMGAVKLLGELSREEMRKKYEEIDVVVCASLEETMSLAITEGMMYEKICVTTDETGIADYIDDGINGFICKAGSAESLFQKMKWILKNTDKCINIAKQARKTYEEYFTLDKLGERLETLLLDTEKQYRVQFLDNRMEL